MERTARQIADEFRIRASATIEICGGEIGLTKNQEETLKGYLQRAKDFENAGMFVPKAKDLTDKQKAEMLTLIHKRDNIELPDGAKTHCKKWLKYYLFNRREELKNKYVDKGNKAEEDGFTLMAVQLKLGMVYKNTERKRNSFSEGECDLYHKKTVYDNKCSWSLDTFPMFETEIPDNRYWWQLQNYSTLWPADDLCLCYTLISSDLESVEGYVKWETDHNKRYQIAERMIFIKSEFEAAKITFFPESTLDTFVEIPEEKRLKKFPFKPDANAVKTIEERSNMCKEYIYQLLLKDGY